MARGSAMVGCDVDGGMQHLGVNARLGLQLGQGPMTVSPDGSSNMHGGSGWVDTTVDCGHCTGSHSVPVRG